MTSPFAIRQPHLQSVATEQTSLPVAYQLCRRESWVNDPGRRGKAGAPEDGIFLLKPETAPAQIRAAQDAGVSPREVLADAGYGNDTAFGTGLRWALLCRRCPVLDPLLVAGHATAAAEAMEQTRSPALARSAD
ncbi:transposase [Mesorhizobium sp. M0106]|uniref:transposase n=1 Tax=Mesorhizobium sp. M0106 TaxID=2956880 RepID=UPI0033379B78